VKSVSFYLERFQRYGVLKMYNYFGATQEVMCKFFMKFGKWVDKILEKVV